MSLLDAIDKYVKSSPAVNPAVNVRYPFFAVVKNEEYTESVNKITERGFKKLLVSNFCEYPDRIPDWDNLKSVIRDEASKNKKLLVLGLSEFFTYSGKDYALQKLKELNDLGVDNGRVILLFRCIGMWVKELERDPRFSESRHYIPDNCLGNHDEWPNKIFRVIRISKEVNLQTGKFCNEFKEFLKSAEEGKDDEYRVWTDLEFSNAVFQVKHISSAYDYIKLNIPNFPVPMSCGTDKFWNILRNDLEDSSFDFAGVLRKHGLNPVCLPEQLYQHLEFSYTNWLYYINLKFFNIPQNSYLKYVLQHTEKQEQLRVNLLGKILDFKHDDLQFKEMYIGRKEFLRTAPSALVRSFIENNRKDLNESLYRLTDATQEERREIISMIVNAGHWDNEILNFIYPDLADYLSEYEFDRLPTNDSLGGILTTYFREYKILKLLNIITPKFKEYVKKNAEIREYYFLHKRDNIVREIHKEKPNSFLFWLDALGVEYLGFIRNRCEKLDLLIDIKVARANLPTITSTNKEFYDTWGESSKFAEKRLDEIKHKDEGGFDFRKNNQPVHLEAELTTINRSLEDIRSILDDKGYDEVILTSDHGASRLAVLTNNEKKIDIESKGKHHGRCCKSNDDIKMEEIPFGTHSDDGKWVVLADYNRIRGGRDADVEVHGGATLEEVVVPVITLKPKNPKKKVELIESEITLGFKEVPILKFFVPRSLGRISITITEGPEGKGKNFPGDEASDHQHFNVPLTEIKRKGSYTAQVYDGENYLTDIRFQILSKGIRDNNMDIFD